MADSPCLFISGAVYFITFRTEDGLPFANIPLVNEILWSNLTKAQNLYDQELIAITMEQNHGHLMLRCKDPETVPAYVGYIKQESAHAINRLTGRKKKTVWAEGYDKPIILDYEKFLDRFAYTLLNPWKDQLVPSMDLYKGLSSYSLFFNNKTSRDTRLISRGSISKLDNPNKPWLESEKALSELFQTNKKEGKVNFNFYSWKYAFPETRFLSDQEIRNLMLKSIKDFEEKVELFLPKKQHYKDLTKQSLLATYQPQKFSPKMICLSFYKELRDNFISFFKLKVAHAKEVYQEWKLGNLSVPYPTGMFAPNLPRTQNLLPAAVPIW